MRTLSGFDEVAWSLLYALDGSLSIDRVYSFDELFFMRSFAVTAIPNSVLPS